MLDFRPIEISDKEWMQPLLDKSPYRCLEYSFTFTYLWRNIFNYSITKFNNYVIIKSYREGYPPSYLFPAGSGDIKPVINILKAHSNGLGSNLIFHAIPTEAKAVLESAFPDDFEYVQLTDYYDYIYDSESLATLAGKKLKSKRNHINFFTHNFPDWSFEPIDESNIEDVKKMSANWLKLESEESFSDTFMLEAQSVDNALADFFKLNMMGGVLKVNKDIVAFTLGDRLTDDTYLIHIEKAYKDVRGAYPMVNQLFAKIIAPNYKYINREDDSGNLGLRKAKQSYRPVFMGEKLGAKYIK